VALGSISKTKFTLFGEYPLIIYDNGLNGKRRLCAQIPFAGGRVFETGDEQFLKFAKQGESYQSSQINLPSRS
jgi:hypothetical protein